MLSRASSMSSPHQEQKASSSFDREVAILVTKLGNITDPETTGQGTIKNAATIIRKHSLSYDKAVEFIEGVLAETIGKLAEQVSKCFSITTKAAATHIGCLYYNSCVNEHEWKLKDDEQDGSVTPRTRVFNNAQEELKQFSSKYLQNLDSTMKRIALIKEQSVIKDAAGDLDGKIIESLNKNNGNLELIIVELDRLTQEVLVHKLMKSKGFYNKDNMSKFFSLVLNCHKGKYDLAYEHADTLTTEVKVLLTSYGYDEQEAFMLIYNVYQNAMNDSKCTKNTLSDIYILSSIYQESVKTTARIAFQYVHQQWLSVDMHVGPLKKIIENQISVQAQILKSRQNVAILGMEVLTTWGKYRLAWNDGHASNPKKSQACYKNPSSIEAKEFYKMFKSPKKQSGCSCCCGQAAVEVREPVSERPH